EIVLTSDGISLQEPTPESRAQQMRVGHSSGECVRYLPKFENALSSVACLQGLARHQTIAHGFQRRIKSVTQFRKRDAPLQMGFHIVQRLDRPNMNCHKFLIRRIDRNLEGLASRTRQVTKSPLFVSRGVEQH